MESSNESLTDGSNEIRTYKRRWWILFLFASLGFMQCSVWNTWGPITLSVEKAYPTWRNSDIALLSMWGTITMIIGLIPFTIYLQKCGMRRSILITTFLLAAGTSIRIVTTEPVPFTILAHIGAILNGFAGIIICIAPSLLSSLWFPLNERTTATGIGCTFNQLGNACGFFLGPSIVKPPDDPIYFIRSSINDYLWIVAGICVGLFILVLAYFPDKPKRPPSTSSACNQPSRPVSEDLKMLISNKNFWLLIIPYSLTLGINVAWSSVVDINVHKMGINQYEASWMGVYLTFGGVLLAIVSSKFTDCFFGHMKVTIICLLTVSTVGFIWFLLIMNGVLPFNKVYLFISVIIGASFGYACSPLFFELSVELSYPVPEGLVGGCVTLAWNTVTVLFLAFLQIQTTDYTWMDYVLAIQGLVSIIFMFFIKEEYRRSPVENRGDADPPLLSDTDSGIIAHSEVSTLA